MGSLCVLLAGAFLYLMDCSLASAISAPQDIPWLERGPYAGVGFLATVAIILGGLAFLILGGDK
jgi:hypothetical protein